MILSASRLGALIALLGVLAACTEFDALEPRYTQTRLYYAANTPAEGGPFTGALRDQYVDLSGLRFEQGRHDWSDVYAGRAQDAARDVLFGPLQLYPGRVDADVHASLAEAREALVAVLTDGARAYVPGIAAEAQAMFDCWLELEIVRGSADEIDQCRTRFLFALARAQTAVDEARARPVPPPPPPPVAAAPPPPPPPAQPERVPTVFVVYFEFDSSDIDLAALRVIDEATAAASKVDAPLTVRGHADRAGADAYNLALSIRRVDAVAAALRDRGIPPEKIVRDAFGEKVPAVITPDGQRHFANRRVEILVETPPLTKPASPLLNG